METWNIMLATDSYKACHHACYDEKVTKVYSYLESRGGEFPASVFFGLQYYLMKYLSGKQVTKEKIDEAEIFWADHLGRTDCFDRRKWEYILERYDGHLPITIEAVPEGTIVPVSNVLMTIVNNDRECFWLTNFIETLLMKVWYPITIASQSYFIRKKVEKALEMSGDPAGINFKVHDFGYRGVSSEETAGLGAAAHLISFMGTDTVAGISMLKKYYQAPQMVGFSIPATEHSIMCSFGRDEEMKACENFIDKFPKGLIACVSDTYDIYNCCKNIWGGKLKEKVLKRDGCLVIRPDSGDPLEVVPKVLEILWDCFGGTEIKGYKVLDPHVRVIQGDGMDYESIGKLYETIMACGWSADNLAVGSGGGLLQKVNRDTGKFAIKCSAALKQNRWIDVYKEPVTDSGKRSKRGRFQVIQFEDGTVETRDYSYTGVHGKNILLPVFENGKILRTYSLEQIKANAYPKQ